MFLFYAAFWCYLLTIGGYVEMHDQSVSFQKRKNNKKLSYRKESVQVLRNIEIRVLQ